MTHIIPLLIIAALAGTACALLPSRRAFANSVGTHAGNITRLTDAALASRHLLVTAGSDEAHVAIAAASDLPLGVATDEAAAAGEPVNIALLGSASSTLRMVAAAAIDAGEAVYTAAAGKVQPLPATPGTYYHVGTALSSAAQDGLVEVDPCVARMTPVSE